MFKRLCVNVLFIYRKKGVSPCWFLWQLDMCSSKILRLVYLVAIVRVFSLHSDVLALPIFKQEDGNPSVESESKNPPFQYVLCAATSPAVKIQEETLTYLNQGT